MRTSSTFTSIMCNYKDPSTSVLYKVSEIATPTTTVTNKFPALIQTFALSQGSTGMGYSTTYTITFTPYNSISSSGSLKLTWPSIVTMYSNVSSTITTGSSFTTAHTVSTTTREIIYKNIFPSNYVGKVTIQLSPVINSRVPTTGSFLITTYDDANQQFQID